MTSNRGSERKWLEGLRYDDKHPRDRETRELLITFALWMSTVWSEENDDDRTAAESWVDHFLEGGEGP